MILPTASSCRAGLASTIMNFAGKHNHPAWPSKKLLRLTIRRCVGQSTAGSRMKMRKPEKDPKKKLLSEGEIIFVFRVASLEKVLETIIVASREKVLKR